MLFSSDEVLVNENQLALRINTNLIASWIVFPLSYLLPPLLSWLYFKATYIIFMLPNTLFRSKSPRARRWMLWKMKLQSCKRNNCTYCSSLEHVSVTLQDPNHENIKCYIFSDVCWVKTWMDWAWKNCTT